MNRTIRPITTADIPALAALHSACFTKNWDESELHTLLNAGVIGMVSHAEGSDANALLQGFILARSVMDEAEIISLGVLPNLRKQGIGSALFKALLNHLSMGSTQKIHLEVEAFNQAAIALYQQQGFTITGRRKNYYKIANQRVDAITMTLAR